MSMSGKMRAKLEAERRERIRLDQVRNTCTSIQSALTDQIASISGEISQSIRQELSSLVTEISNLSNKIQNEPDKTLIEIQNYQKHVITVITQGLSKKMEWDNYQVELEELKIKAQIEIDSLNNLGLKLATVKYAQLNEKFSNLHGGNTTKEILDQIIEEVEQTRVEIEEEEVRRETVKNIIEMFRDLGFKSSKPKIKENVVTLVGTLPSGKKAYFNVDVEGTIDFDFEGYNGRTCKDQLDSIQNELKSKYNMESEVEQFEWHNPDLLDKGSKDFPIGGQKRSRQA